jgi:hypothetical protein
MALAGKIFFRNINCCYRKLRGLKLFYGLKEPKVPQGKRAMDVRLVKKAA